MGVQFAHSRLADPCDKKVKKSVKEKNFRN